VAVDKRRLAVHTPSLFGRSTDRWLRSRGVPDMTIATEERQQSPVERRGDVARSIIDATRTCLLESGYASLSTRRVAEEAGVPLSQIHYHFGSKRELLLAVLVAETERLLERQAAIYDLPEPLSTRWDRACDYLEEDLASGYVRIVSELIAAGWSDPGIAAAVRDVLRGWFELLGDVVRREVDRGLRIKPFEPGEVAALMGLPLMGAESAILLGFEEAELPARAALRKIGGLLRVLETRPVRP
jgi:AcrR family transcriptional regulator